jgi:chorismate synthase
MSTRQQSLFPGIQVDQTKIHVKGKVEAGYDTGNKLTLGDVIQIVVTGHITGIGVGLDEKLEQTVGHYVMTADNVKLVEVGERQENQE